MSLTFWSQRAQSRAAATDENFDLVTENTEVEPEDTEQFILRGLCVSSVNSVSKDCGFRADRIICTQENNGFRDSDQMPARRKTSHGTPVATPPRPGIQSLLPQRLQNFASLS